MQNLKRKKGFARLTITLLLSIASIASIAFTANMPSTQLLNK